MYIDYGRPYYDYRSAGAYKHTKTNFQKPAYISANAVPQNQYDTAKKVSDTVTANTQTRLDPYVRYATDLNGDVKYQHDVKQDNISDFYNNRTRLGFKANQALDNELGKGYKSYIDSNGRVQVYKSDQTENLIKGVINHQKDAQGNNTTNFEDLTDWKDDLAAHNIRTSEVEESKDDYMKRKMKETGQNRNAFINGPFDERKFQDDYIKSKGYKRNPKTNKLSSRDWQDVQNAMANAKTNYKEGYTADFLDDYDKNHEKKFVYTDENNQIVNNKTIGELARRHSGERLNLNKNQITALGDILRDTNRNLKETMRFDKRTQLMRDRLDAENDKFDEEKHGIIARKAHKALTNMKERELEDREASDWGSYHKKGGAWNWLKRNSLALLSGDNANLSLREIIHDKYVNFSARNRKRYQPIPKNEIGLLENSFNTNNFSIDTSLGSRVIHLGWHHGL